MGCFWSREGDQDQCQHCNRKARNNLIIIDRECEICLSRANRPRGSVRYRPLFGEYKCPCRREWISRRSWSGRYQVCKRCKRHVYPCNQRELRPSDTSRDRENMQDHPKELCQMCIELGYYCGKLSSMKFPNN